MKCKLNFKVFFLLIFSCLFFASCSDKTFEQTDSKYVSLNDSVRIHYKVYGSGDNYMVFVHGFGCDINAWQFQPEYFKDKSKMIFIDLPGFGASDKPQTEYDLDFFADAVKVVLDAEKVEGAVLVGHSLGTPVCRQVTFKYPKLVSKLVDVDGVYCFYPADSAVLAAYNSLPEAFSGDDLKPVFDGFISSLFIPQTPENVVKYASDIMPQTLNHVAYSTMKNLIDEKFWTGEKISVPTLVFAAKSSQIPPQYEEIMKALYPNMNYVELDSIGHFIMMEKPEMFNKKLEDFLNE